MAQTITLRKPQFINVDSLKPGRHGYNVYLKVIDVNFEKANKADGTTLEIAEVLAGDETGVVKVRAIGENASKFTKGKVIAIRNGRSEVFKERMRLEVDKWGKITEEPNHEVKSVKTDNNLSEVEYEMKVVRVPGGRGGDREGNREEGGERRGGRGGYRGSGRGDGRRGGARRGPGARRD